MAKSELDQVKSELRSEFQDMIGAITKQTTELINAQASAFSKALSEVTSVIGRLGDQVKMESLEDKRARKLKALEEVIATAEAELLDGPRKFRVRMPYEDGPYRGPEGQEGLTTRIVGASDPYNAQAKYKKHFGIIKTRGDWDEIEDVTEAWNAEQLAKETAETASDK